MKVTFMAERAYVWSTADLKSRLDYVWSLYVLSATDNHSSRLEETALYNEYQAIRAELASRQ